MKRQFVPRFSLARRSFISLMADVCPGHISISFWCRSMPRDATRGFDGSPEAAGAVHRILAHATVLSILDQPLANSTAKGPRYR
jgi:hypothetical protein